MKKLIKISVLCFIGSVLMTSCNSNFSITKRHYTKGYYVDNAKSKHVKVSVEENDKLSGPEGSESSVDQREGSGSSAMNNAEHSVVENTAGVSNSKNGQNETKSSRLKEVKGASESELSVNPLTKIKNTYVKLKYAKHGAKEGEGLSLFWIIILVILILWLLGVISTGFAIGSVINLLLLVALILLILWLLRII